MYFPYSFFTYEIIKIRVLNQLSSLGEYKYFQFLKMDKK